MQLDVALAIAGISLIFNLIQGILALRRAGHTDASKSATELTTVIVKLENIGKDTAEIKSDLREVRGETKNHGERLVRLEQQIKTINKKVFRGENI